MFCGVLQPHLFWTTRVLIGLFPAASALSHEDPTPAEPREAASPRPCRCTARARMSHGNSSSCLFPPPLTSPSTPSRSVCFCCWFSRRDNPPLSLSPAIFRRHQCPRLSHFVRSCWVSKQEICFANGRRIKGEIGFDSA